MDAAKTRAFLLTSLKSKLSMATETLTAALKTKSRPTWIQNFARKQVLARLARLQIGQITIVENGEQTVFGHDKSIQATVTVLDAHFTVKSPSAAALARVRHICWVIRAQITSPMSCVLYAPIKT